MAIVEFPGGSRIRSNTEPVIGKDFNIGPDVVIDCEHISIGDHCNIGVPGEEGYRYPGGVRIRVENLRLDTQAKIERHVLIKGGDIKLHRLVQIGNEVTIRVDKRLIIGTHGVVNSGCEIAGRDVVFGRELWMLPQAKVGGGSAFEVHSQLKVGNWCHIGTRCFLNTARPITIGDEVGLGTQTSLYTHGAYPSFLDGKPVAFGPISIGDRTWLPGAVVNPSVSIGKDCVVGVQSVVTRDLPAGCFAAGAPAKVLKENAYPRPIPTEARQEFLKTFLQVFSEICSESFRVSIISKNSNFEFTADDTLIAFMPGLERPCEEWSSYAKIILVIDQSGSTLPTLPTNVTIVNCLDKTIEGPGNKLTEKLLNQFRRYGVRFNFELINGHYRAWAD